MKSFADIATDYAQSVVDKNILACKWIILACRRHLDDLKKSELESYLFKFDETKVSKACRFIQNLPHVKGKFAAKRQTIHLQPWQVFLVGSIFGWVDKVTGLRKYRQAYLLVPRKNGKSPIAAAIGLYMLTCDNESGAEVYCGATGEKQAWEVFGPARLMVDRTPDLQEAFGITINAKSLIIESDGSKFLPVIGKPGDGASVSCGICDEFHEADDSSLYDTFRTGMVGREQPLLVVITTAGYNIASACHDIEVDAYKVLEGIIDNERMFILIYTINADTDWTSYEALKMANPNLGISVEEATLIYDQKEAIQNSSKQNTFKTKHLNIWCNAKSAWMNMEAWQRSKDSTLTPDMFLKDPCFIGIDLASTTDLSSVIKVFVRTVDGKPNYYIFGNHYLPDERIIQPECQHYQKWNHDNVLTGTQGASIDYVIIKSDLLSDTSKYLVKEICYDKTYCAQMMQEVSADGHTVVEVPQRVQFLSPSMKALEAAVLDKRVHHNGDPVLTWCISNVVASIDANENIFPRKDKPELKIDAAVALINAFNRVATFAIKPKSKFFKPFTI
jgi:phage terminase large subunit-like protein